jgi:hypothetical protein
VLEHFGEIGFLPPRRALSTQHSLLSFKGEEVKEDHESTKGRKHEKISWSGLMVRLFRVLGLSCFRDVIEFESLPFS